MNDPNNPMQPLNDVNDALNALASDHGSIPDTDMNDLTHLVAEALGIRPMQEQTAVALHGRPVTARAATHPCQLHRYHAPRVVRTQAHHRKPVYLQNRVYGNIQNGEILWVCGTCHDSIHAWLSFLLGEAYRPEPEPGVKAKREAERAYDWYVQETANQHSPGE